MIVNGLSVMRMISRCDCPAGLVFVATAIALSACIAPAPRVNLNDSQAVAGAISVQRDDFKKVTKYEGPNAADNVFDKLFIRAWKIDGTEDVGYQIYVMDYYNGDWRFYNSAYDSNGNSLKTTLISRDVGSCNRYGCSHYEHVGLNVSREYLAKNQDSSIRFKISGKAGEEVFFIPGAYIKAFLSVAK
ncbi:hypothetical protein [Pseudothauera hydrothermalis]|uniref:hypothetical protein n=1 Tax=Pseudothauera hydrothermalis TaxID=2184083 RepID=UPI0013C2D075|nr:hypothetical protein [Pseudothauera hydrothermalis]